MPAPPDARVPPEGPDPSDWRSHGLRRLIRRYAQEITRWPTGFILLLPDTEQPVPRPIDAPFTRVVTGRPVAAFRVAPDGTIAILALAAESWEPRVRAALDGHARLDALGLAERERGRDSVLAFAMNVYDEFGLHAAFAPV